MTLGGLNTRVQVRATSGEQARAKERIDPATVFAPVTPHDKDGDYETEPRVVVDKGTVVYGSDGLPVEPKATPSSSPRQGDKVRVLPAGGVITLSIPPPPDPQSKPTLCVYVWNAKKGISGYVPIDQLKGNDAINKRPVPAGEILEKARAYGRHPNAVRTDGTYTEAGRRLMSRRMKPNSRATVQPKGMDPQARARAKFPYQIKRKDGKLVLVTTLTGPNGKPLLDKAGKPINREVVIERVRKGDKVTLKFPKGFTPRSVTGTVSKGGYVSFKPRVRVTDPSGAPLTAKSSAHDISIYGEKPERPGCVYGLTNLLLHQRDGGQVGAILRKNTPVERTTVTRTIPRSNPELTFRLCIVTLPKPNQPDKVAVWINDACLNPPNGK